MGTGEVKSIPKEEAMLIQEFSQSDLDIPIICLLPSPLLVLVLTYVDMIQIDLRTESVILKDLGISFQCEVFPSRF